MDKKVRVYIEIEKDSNLKFEYNHNTKNLELDRILQEPFVYPYPYGFILDTKAKDDDELDALILTNKKINNDTYHDAYIIGALKMEDERGMDEKVLCVLEDDYNKINDLSQIDDNIKDQIYNFFKDYKKDSSDRWSKVYGYEDKLNAIKIYEESLISDNS